MDVTRFNKDEQSNWTGGNSNTTGGSQFWFDERQKKLGGDKNW